MSGAVCNYNCNRTATYPDDDESNDDDSNMSDSGEFVAGNQVTLDGNGKAKIVIPTGDQDENEPLMAYTVSATVQDSSDNAVTSQSSVDVAQGDITIEATPSSTIAHVGDHVSVVADVTGVKGQALPGITIHVAASYDDWIDGQDVLTPITSADQTTSADGSTSFMVVPTKPGLIDVDYSGVDDRGNKVTTTTQIWVPGRDTNIQAQYSDLSILLNKPKYAPGDVAKVLITTLHPGPDALVTVEGTTLYKTLLVPLVHNATEIDLLVTEDYAPGVTISATCIVDKQCLTSQQNLVLNDPQRSLTVSVNPAHTHYHPGDSATISIHTADSHGHPKAADVSVAIVDSAIYSIAPEPPGTIMDAFLPEQSDNVQSFDSTGVVYYGDVDKGSTDIDIRRKFPDTALWEPDVQTDSSGNATVNVTLPDNLTTWRITCYGQTSDTLVGKGVGQLVVNKDLAVRLEVPTFLINGDQSTMAALVDNNTDHPLSVQLRMSADGLQALGETTQSVEVSPGSPATVSWPIVAPKSGTYNPVVTVQSGSLSDGITEPIPVYPHGAKSFTWAAGTTTGTSTTTLNFSANSLRADSDLTIRLTPTLLSALPPAAQYLSSYPYGSSDSTSSALVADATLYSAQGSLHLSPTLDQLLKSETEQALLRLYKEQNDDGGWGWFPTDQSDCWMTAYATYGLTLAKADGIAVNQSIYTAAVDETETLSRTEREKNKIYEMNLRAIALSALVLSQNGGGSEADHEVNFLMHQWTIDHVDEEYEDVAAAAIAEQKIGSAQSLVKANELMSIIWAGERETGAMMSWTSQYHSSSKLAGEFDPDDETTAWVLYAAENVTPRDPRIDEIALWLMANRNDSFWDGVDATGVTVLALAQFAGQTNELRPNMVVQTAVNGTPTGAFQFKPDSVGAPDVVVTIPGTALNAGGNIVTLSKTGTGRLYYSLTMEQTGLIPHQSDPPSFIEAVYDRLLHPPHPLPLAASGYRIKRIYMRMTSRRSFLWEDTVPTRDWQFNEGDSILVRLIIDSVRPGSRIVLDEPVPPGCRIAETSGEFDEDWNNWWDYTDVRDSDIVFFVYNLTSGRHEIDYHLVAQRAGRYDIMPTAATSMVDPTLDALGEASAVKIDGQ